MIQSTYILENLKLFRSGKVREVYDLGQYLLMVASDRISAFDVIMNEPITDKGKMLSQISVYWFENTQDIVKNHFITNDVSKYPTECQPYKDYLDGRSMLVRKCQPLPVECIVRGYVAGSGWKEYQRSKTICGIPLPDGLLEFSRLPQPIFTPSTKAEVGHDENINPSQVADLIGQELADKVSRLSIDLYKFGAVHAERRGIILADTKFEFGTDESGELILIDECLTPDSSRFWLTEEYAPGKPQTNFDKQVLRDYLESIDWNKMPPPPPLPVEIIKKTSDKYKEALRRIMS